MKYCNLASLWLTTPLGKVVFMLSGAVATVCFIPYAAVATFTFVACVFTCPQIEFNTLGVLLLGPSGLLGISGAWLRVIFPNKKFRASRKLRITTAGLLSFGIIANTVLLAVFMHDKKWGLVGVFAVSFFFGAFLLAATFGNAASENSP